MLRFNEESDIFAIERNRGLESIINNIYQTFDNCDVYKSVLKYTLFNVTIPYSLQINNKIYIFVVKLI